MDIIKLQYTEDFVRRSIKSYWWKQVGPLFLGTIVVMAVFLINLIFIGERSWLVTMLGIVVPLGITVVTASYFVHLKRALIRLRRMKKPAATLILTNNRFGIASDVGESESEWSIITKVWQFEEVWLLFFSAGEFMTLPTKNMPERHQEFILSKLNENGAKLV